MIYGPREDSFLILKYIKDYAKGRVLDVGCGSGILSFEAAKYADVEAVDIDKEAVKKIKGIKAYVSNLFENVKRKFDLIIFNPPYLPLDEREDEESRRVTTGGMKGNEILKRFFNEIGDYLNENSKILIVVSSLTPDVEKIIEKNDFKFKVLEEKKMFYEVLRVILVWKAL